MGNRVLRRRWRAAGSFVAIVAVAVLGLAPVAPAAAYPVDPNWAPPRTVFIPETGQTIDRAFLDLWLSGGGAISWGNPVSPEITLDDGRIVQYYEYARFEYWPDGDANGNYVTLGAIGAELRPLAVPRRPVATPARRSTTRTIKSFASAAAAVTEQRAWIHYASEADIDLSGGDPYQQGTYRFVPETGHGVWGGFRAFWEATGEAAYLGNPLTEEYVVADTSYQVFERGKLRWREGEDILMEPVGTLLTERYGLDTDPQRQGDIPTYDPALFVPPIAVPDPSAPPAAAPGYPRSIVVSLSQQALWAFDGDSVVLTTYVSTGTEKFATPPGLFFVNSKIPVQDMAGVLGGESYNVPQVPDVMYFTNRGHAIHGTYWHTNFGAPMSHGCINLPLDVSAWMYQWAPLGMAVLIVP